MRTSSTVPKTVVREREPSRRWEQIRSPDDPWRHKAGPTSPLPRCCKWAWRRRRCTSRPLPCCWDSIWWRGSCRALLDANQDWSRANSRAAGVVPERVELAIVICLRYYHRKHHATDSSLYERNPAPGTECHPGTPHAALRRTQAGPRATGAFLQRDGAEADDEVRQSPLRLRLRPRQASRALLRDHLQDQWENGQCEALAGGGSPIQGCLPAVSKAEDSAQASRKALANHPAVPSQTDPVPAPRLIAKTGVIPISRLKPPAADRANHPNYQFSQVVSRRSKVAAPKSIGRHEIGSAFRGSSALHAVGDSYLLLTRPSPQLPTIELRFQFRYAASLP